MYCIIVTGIPASGKTTMAKYLSEQFHIPMISKDLIKEILYDEVGFHGRPEKVKLGNASMEIMYYMAEQLMQFQQPFILENNFEHVSKEGLFAILEKYSYTAITVRMTGDYEALYKRFEKRNNSPERHRGHVVNDQYPEPEFRTEAPPTMTYDIFMDAIKRRGFDSFIGNGPLVTVDTTDFARVDRDDVVTQVQKHIEILK